MNAVALNWNDTAFGVAVFRDLLDPSLLHYGPSVAWGTPTVQPLGNFVLFRGQIDFGVAPNLLAALQQKYPGMRLAALMAVDVQNGVAISAAPAPPHLAKLSLVPSLPFPSLTVSVTISKADPLYQALVDSLVKGWEERSLLSGSVVFTYEGKVVRCASLVSLPLRKLHRYLDEIVPFGPVSRDVMFAGAATCVAAHSQELITSRVPDGSPNDYLTAVHSFIVGKMGDLLFRPARDVLDWDSGDTLPGFELQPAEGLADSMSYTLNSSVNARTTLQFLQP